jgi:hypothetical protein
LLCLARIFRGNKGCLFGSLAALSFACSFWIGAEGLPWVMLFIACLGLAAAWNKNIARDAAIFGICLPVFTAALIPLALPTSEFSSRALSWFSPAYAIFAALSGGIFILGWFLGHVVDNKAARLSLYALLGFAAGCAFFALIPSALHGPFADYDTFDATIALDNITEAQPLIHAFHVSRFLPTTWIHAGFVFLHLLVLPIVAFFVCLQRARRDRDERLIWLVQGVFLLASFALTVFWQSRVGMFMELFSIVPLTYLLAAWWSELTWSLWDRPLFWAEIGVFLLLGPLFVVLLPAAFQHARLYPDIALFPAARGAPVCPLEPVLPFLNDPEKVGAKPLTIMNTSDTGPQLLFATLHRVISGNFDVPGNADTFAFFSATKDAEAITAAKKWGVDAVLICKTAPTLYVGKDYYALNHVRLLQGPDGLLHLSNADVAQPLIERLIKGQNPVWLKPIEIYSPSDYLLFRIQYPAGLK